MKVLVWMVLLCFLAVVATVAVVAEYLVRIPAIEIVETKKA